MPLRAIAFAVSVLLAAVPAAGAEKVLSAAAASLEDARRLINVELRFKEAIELLERALADPRITREERVEAHLLLGIACVARGSTERAEAAFAEVLGIDPNYQLDPLLSPKIQRVFARVRDKLARAPRILEVTAVREGDRVAFSARIEDADSRLARVHLYTRSGGKPYEEQLMERDGDRVSAAVDAHGDEKDPWFRIEYYVVGRDGSGSTVARVSDPENPSSVIVEKPKPIDLAPVPEEIRPDAPKLMPIDERSTVDDDPWYGEWWIWAIAIGAVVGAGTAIIVIGGNNHDDPSGTLDPIHL